MTDDAISLGRVRRAPPPCPICGKAADGGDLPFCGPRCADVDLGRWLTGQYRVPGPTLSEVEDEQDAVRARDGGAGGA